MHYIDYVLTDDERHIIETKGLNVGEVTVGNQTFHRHGIAFPADEENDVLEALGLIPPASYPVELDTPQGEETDFMLVEPVAMPTTANSIVCIGTLPDDSAYRDHLAELQLGLVIYSNDGDSGGRRFHIYRPNVLFVNIKKMPLDTDGIADNRYRNGYVLIAVQPLESTYIPIRDDSDRIVAYFRGDDKGGSLWLTYRPYDHPDSQVLDYVLHTVARLMHTSLGPVLTYEEYSSIWSRLNYMRMVRRNLEREVANIDSRIEDIDFEAAQARRELVSALRNANMARRRRSELHARDQEELIREMTEVLDKGLQNLSTSSDFESLDFLDRHFEATTRPIKIRYGGRIYEMGRYEICVYFGTDKLDIKSADDVSWNGYPHPHIAAGGEPCFGNISESVAQLQSQMDLGTLLPYLVRFLEDGYNPADSYARIEEFGVQNYPENEEVQNGAITEPAESNGGRGRARLRRNPR